LSQEVLLEHRAKVAASKREQHRKRQGEDEASNEKAAIKLYERERKRVAPPQKNQTDCILFSLAILQNKADPLSPLTRGNMTRLIVTSTAANFIHL
jgi:sRNA-binding protein